MIAAAALSTGGRTPTITGPPPSSDHPTQPFLADGHVHHPSRALHFIAGVHVRILAQQHDADLLLVDAERNAEDVPGKPEQFLRPNAGQARDAGNAVRDIHDGVGLAWHQLGRKAVARLADVGERAVEDALQGVG
jgi:hypothetical protein